MPVLEILEGGFLTTVQDQGRSGWARYGVPPSGPMDAVAFSVANRLVGNPPETAALEITLTGPVLRSSTDILIAVCGADFELWAGALPVPMWHAIFVRRGDLIVFGERKSGARAYLAIAGGIAVPTFLGSRSTYLPGGFGGLQGRALRAGDDLPLGAAELRSLDERAGRHWPHEQRPRYSPRACVRVIPGPQEDRFTHNSLEAFLHSAYGVTSQVDRMGLRLQGAPIHRRDGAGFVSDGVVTGCIQVPPDGQPIVMMVDHQTTGGYPKIATVIREDLPLLAQLLPGDSVTFRAIAPSQAG